MTAAKRIFGALAVVAWIAFLLIDHAWQRVLVQAVTDQTATYPETYGPLSFFRPVTLYLALAASLVCVGLLVLTRSRPAA